MPSMSYCAFENTSGELDQLGDMLQTSLFYKIEESVGQYYIVLDGIYTTREAAEAAIQKYPNNTKMRVVPYVRNGIYGSVRVE